MIAPSFNPAALQGLDASFGDDDATLVAASDEEIKRVAGADLRRKLAALKLAPRIVGMAMVQRGVSRTAGKDRAPSEMIGDADVLSTMRALLARLGSARKLALDAVGVGRESGDFAAAFNSSTSTVMDVLTEEWKCATLGGQAAIPFPLEHLGELLRDAVGNGPMYLDEDDSGDLKTVRRLCVLESLPKLWAVANMWDYFQPERERLVARLARAVSEQAEAHAVVLYADATPSFAVRAIVQRMYATSAALMCEVYKESATGDVSRLRSMSEMDRSVLLARYEATGMDYDHVIQRHRAVMDRALDTTRLILESAVRDQPKMENSYGASS